MCQAYTICMLMINNEKKTWMLLYKLKYKMKMKWYDPLFFFLTIAMCSFYYKNRGQNVKNLNLYFLTRSHETMIFQLWKTNILITQSWLSPNLPSPPSPSSPQNFKTYLGLPCVWNRTYNEKIRQNCNFNFGHPVVLDPKST